MSGTKPANWKEAARVLFTFKLRCNWVRDSLRDHIAIQKLAYKCSALTPHPLLSILISGTVDPRMKSPLHTERRKNSQL